MRRFRFPGTRVGLALIGVVAASCPAPHDVTPQIRVVPEAAGRWVGLLARDADGDAGTVKSARVHRMRDGEQLGGPNAVGRPGDLILENDEVVFVVDQLGSSNGFAESGGNIIDAADAVVRKDELGQVFTHFGAFPRQGVYDAVASGVSGDGSAWIEAKGRELYEQRLAVTTRYTLHPSDRALLLETSVENTGSTIIEIPGVGDVFQWGGAEKVAPGMPRGFRGASSGPYIGGVGRFTSYAITSTDGRIDGTSGAFWTDTLQRRDMKLPPRGKASYERLLVVGQRPDTSSLVSELALAAGQAVGDVRVRVSQPGALPMGSVVSLLAEGSREPLTLAPPFIGQLPAARYWVAPMAGSRGSAQPLGPLDVKPGLEATVDLSVEPAANIEIRCVERKSSREHDNAHPVPCKVTMQGTEGTPDPDFGPAHMAGPARNQATTSDGLVRLSIAAGKYRLTASRGPEYSVASVVVDLAPGAVTAQEMPIARVVDTRGYLACDFHQHTVLSADSPVAAQDRVVANVAEGVEVAVASEHNAVANLEPIVKKLHLEGEFVSISGDEITTDASLRPWGHVNAFPMPYDPSRPRGGAPGARDRTPQELFAEVRSYPGGDRVIQVNHPHSGASGYFDRLGFDRAGGVGTDARYDATYDAIEVWTGRNIESRARVIDDLRALLRTGHVVTAVATTDTHGIVGQEAGYPRTYVRVPDDARLEAWEAARTAALVRSIKAAHDVVLTNGPMIRVSANGAPIGGIARGRRVTLKVHIECAPWVKVDRVRVLRANDGSQASDDEKRVKLTPLSSGARATDVTFALELDRDDALMVIATGDEPLSPVLAGGGAEIFPWAMSGPIWVDADEDGRALGR
jgi:hypothetical protein